MKIKLTNVRYETGPSELEIEIPDHCEPENVDSTIVEAIYERTGCSAASWDDDRPEELRIP